MLAPLASLRLWLRWPATETMATTANTKPPVLRRCGDTIEADCPAESESSATEGAEVGSATAVTTEVVGDMIIQWLRLGEGGRREGGLCSGGMLASA